MKKLLLAFLAILACSACATTTNSSTTDIKADANERAGKILAAATHVNNATGTLMRISGPTVVSLYCAAQPPNCPAASQAYTLALAAQKEYAALLADASAANAAPDGLKLATLASTFQRHFLVLSQLTGKGDPAAMGEFQTKLAELQNIAIQ